MSAIYQLLVWINKPRVSLIHITIAASCCMLLLLNAISPTSEHCVSVERDNVVLKTLLRRKETLDQILRRQNVSDDVLVIAAKYLLSDRQSRVKSRPADVREVKKLRGSLSIPTPGGAEKNPTDKNGFQCGMRHDDGVLDDITLQPMATLGQLEIVPGANKWGIPMANSTLTVDGVKMTFDQILYGYDLIFEDLAIFSRTSWFGISLQQDPSDAFALQGLLWRNQPDLLIEIGTNTGGGAVFYASIMRAYNSQALVITVDPKDPAQDWAQGITHGCEDCIDARCADVWHTNIKFLLGYSHDVFVQIKEIARNYHKVMVMHDGSHFYDDVLRDLKMFDEITSVGSYMIVQDTKMTRMYSDWAKNGYPLRAAEDFLSTQGKGRYRVDRRYEYALYSQHHNGWLRKMAS